VQLQQANATALVTEEDQVLTQDPDPDGQVLQLVAKADRLPEPAQVLTAGGVGADMGKLYILAGHLPMIVGSKLFPKELGGDRMRSAHGFETPLA
jgi:hypothetical protein